MNLPKNLNELSKGELIRIIYDQHDQIDALKEQLAEFRSRLNDQGPNKSV